MDKNTKQKIILITGGAGYVGAMLCDQFSKRPDVKEIIAIDKEPMTSLLKDNKKILYLQNNTSDKKWQDIASIKNPDVIIHTA